MRVLLYGLLALVGLAFYRNGNIRDALALYRLSEGQKRAKREMKGNTAKLGFGHTLAELDSGMPNGILTDCEAYGMVSGCDENCPVLIAGHCELQDEDNKELYALAKEIWGINP